MKKKLMSVLLAAVMAVSLAACGGSSGSGGGGGSEDGGSESSALNLMIETPVESLDPQQATDGTSFEVIADYTDGLMQMDEDGQPVNAIAKDFKTSEDGLTWTFTLRDDANWSNGDPVTADDFVYGWQRAVDPDVGSKYNYMMSDIGQIKNAEDIIAGKKDKEELGVKAADDKTLEVTLSSPVSYFLSLMYFPTFYPVNQSFFEDVGDSFGTSPDTVLSNGAFTLDSYEPSATAFSLVKNEDYYDADSVSLSGLNYKVIQDSQQALQSYQSGELDMTMVNGEQVDEVSDDPEFRTTGSGYLWYVVPNIKAVKELSNPNIREAITLAIDRKAITRDILRDGSVPTYTAVPPRFATGPDGKDFSEDQKKFKDVCTFDKDRAGKAWRKGLKELGISSLELEMVVDSDDAPQKVAQVLMEQWESALDGLSVSLKVEPKKQRLLDMQEGSFELGLTRWGPDYADPMTYLGMWRSGSPNNYGKWSGGQFDSILDECTTGRLSTDPKKRWDRLHDAEKIIMDEFVIMPVYTQTNAEMVSSTVEGAAFHPVGINRVFKFAVKSYE